MPEPCTSFTFHSNRILKLGRKSCLCMHKFLHIIFQFTLNHVVCKSKTAVTRQTEQYTNNWCIFIMRQKAATRWQIFCLFSPSWEMQCELYWERYLVIVLFDDGIIEASSLLVFVLLHEEDMGHIQLPCVVLIAKLHRLAEDLLHLCTQSTAWFSVRKGSMRCLLNGGPGP